MARKFNGKLIEWDAARGFGFLQCGSARVFVHRREFSERRKAIEKGDRLRFLMGQDEEGRTCAKMVEHVSNDGALSLVALLLCVILLFLPALAVESFSPNWLWVGVYFGVINILTALLYVWDKWKARQRAWRVSEMQVHLFELLGGWPAALLLQHKAAKWSYQIVFWLIVIGYQLLAFEVVSGGRLVRGGWEALSQKAGEFLRGK